MAIGGFNTSDETRRGLDETRRLLYTLRQTISRGSEPGDELMGTIINSLLHHHPDVGIGHFAADDDGWCQAAIDKITERLGD